MTYLDRAVVRRYWAPLLLAFLCVALTVPFGALWAVVVGVFALGPLWTLALGEALGGEGRPTERVLRAALSVSAATTIGVAAAVLATSPSRAGVLAIGAFWALCTAFLALATLPALALGRRPPSGRRRPTANILRTVVLLLPLLAGGLWLLVKTREAPEWPVRLQAGETLHRSVWPWIAGSYELRLRWMAHLGEETWAERLRVRYRILEDGEPIRVGRWAQSIKGWRYVDLTTFEVRPFRRYDVLLDVEGDFPALAAVGPLLLLDPGPTQWLRLRAFLLLLLSLALGAVVWSRTAAHRREGVATATAPPTMPSGPLAPATPSGALAPAPLSGELSPATPSGALAPATPSGALSAAMPSGALDTRNESTARWRPDRLLLAPVLRRHAWPLGAATVVLLMARGAGDVWIAAALLLVVLPVVTLALCDALAQGGADRSGRVRAAATLAVASLLGPGTLYLLLVLTLGGEAGFLWGLSAGVLAAVGLTLAFVAAASVLLRVRARYGRAATPPPAAWHAAAALAMVAMAVALLFLQESPLLVESALPTGGAAAAQVTLSDPFRAQYGVGVDFADSLPSSLAGSEVDLEWRVLRGGRLLDQGRERHILDYPPISVGDFGTRPFRRYTVALTVHAAPRGLAAATPALAVMRRGNYLNRPLGTLLAVLGLVALAGSFALQARRATRSARAGGDDVVAAPAP